MFLRNVDFNSAEFRDAFLKLWKKRKWAPPIIIFLYYCRIKVHTVHPRAALQGGGHTRHSFFTPARGYGRSA